MTETKTKPAPTPEQLAKREERKKRRAAKEAAFEASLAQSKQAHPEIWVQVDTVVTSVQSLPQEEQSVTADVVARVLRNRLQPGRGAKGREKAVAKIERYKTQMRKALAQLGLDEATIEAQVNSIQIPTQ